MGRPFGAAISQVDALESASGQCGTPGLTALAEATPSSPTRARRRRSGRRCVKDSGYNPVVDQSLPGADLVERGLADLAGGEESIEALLVSIGAPRLRRLGIAVADALPNPERRLYDILASTDSDAAHSRYNALIRRLVSFERALECVNPRT